jgi:two-component system, NarL family, invasion response regulator UvrY
MIRLLIADDEPRTRQALAELVTDTPDIRVVGQVESTTELLAVASRDVCDVLVLDLSLLGSALATVLRELQGRERRPRVLVVSAHPEEQFTWRLLEQGADGYLMKELAPQELVRAIRRVYAGATYLSPGLYRQLGQDPSIIDDPPSLPALAALGPEEAVLRLLAAGKSLPEVAELLALTASEITGYRDRFIDTLQPGPASG